MRKRQVILLESAEADLNDIADWLIEFASETIASRYVARIAKRVETLAYASERGSVRPEAAELRIIGLMRGVSVAFVVDGDTVAVHRILYRGRSFQPTQDAGDDD
jgi:plasmid stabilization system protein ParE